MNGSKLLASNNKSLSVGDTFSLGLQTGSKKSNLAWRVTRIDTLLRGEAQEAAQAAEATSKKPSPAKISLYSKISEEIRCPICSEAFVQVSKGCWCS